VLTAALLLVSCSTAGPTEAPPILTPPQIGESQISETEVPRVSLEEAKAAFDAKTAVFLDVRSAGSYAAGHVPGALSIPLNEMDARLGELDPQQWIITYCT
jgi:3-mercaptopyruvate sulfurtransferase SseA